MRTLAIAFIGLLATSAVVQAGTAQFVKNGGFEKVNPKSVNASGNFEFGVSYPANLNAVPNWSSPGANAYNLIYQSSNAFTPAGNAQGQYTYTGKEYLQPGYVGSGSVVGTGDPNGGGLRFAAVDGDPAINGPITQMITGLVVGQIYKLRFDWAAAQVASRTGATTDQFQVSLGKSSFNTDAISLPSAGFSGWRGATHTFTADATSELLSFLDAGTPTGLPPIALLDNVSLIGPSNTTVPEPAAIAILGLGLASLGAARLRRRS